MIHITRTPLRISLFGGGTDYPEYFERREGRVVGLSINKYINIAAMRLSNLQPYSYRVSYSKVETCQNIADIDHPVVRSVLGYFEVPDGLDISVISDLPATGNGLGSSSSFTVGMVNLAISLLDEKMTRMDIAKTAIMVERELLKENVGVQDQCHTTFGGINQFTFTKNHISIEPLQLSRSIQRMLNSCLVLVHTGIGRRATNVVDEQLNKTKSNQLDNDLSYLYALASEGKILLESGKENTLLELGRMLSESWMVKRSLSSACSNSYIDEIYEKIMREGALGAKLCGAGGGGFFLAIVPEEQRKKWEKGMSGLNTIPIQMDTNGTQSLRME